MEGLQAYGASDSDSEKEANGRQPATMPAAVNAAPDVASPSSLLGSTAQTDSLPAAPQQHPSR